MINATREGVRASVTQVDNAQGIPGIVHNTIQTNSTGLVLADLTHTETCVPYARPTATSLPVATRTRCRGMSSGSRRRTYYHSFFARFFGTTISLSTSLDMVIE